MTIQQCINRLRHLKKFKSHWYYWHIGYRFVAIISMLVSGFVSVIFLAIAGHFSILGVVIAITLDALGFCLAVLYLLVIRGSLSSFAFLQSGADSIILDHLIIPILLSFVIARISTFYVAKVFLTDRNNDSRVS